MTQPTSLQDQLRILAGAKKPCSNLADLTCHQNPGSNVPPTYICNLCHSTGQVYVLPDVVRKPCPQLNGYVYGKKHKSNATACFLCHGSGWVVSKRLKDWLETSLAIAAGVYFYPARQGMPPGVQLGVASRVVSGSGLDGLSKAITEFLEAHGVKLE